jgi:hypothetical protein
MGEPVDDTDGLWWIDAGKDHPRLWWERGDGMKFEVRMSKSETSSNR